jgi:uncharacterized RDD family membrane protein YckC
MSIEAETPAISGPRYARFSRRLRGIMLDWIITLSVIAGALLVAASTRNDDVSRALGILMVTVVLLYEPVLVSFTGGTVGHYFSNLRVVDDRGGNVSFLKASARMVVKGLLGWYSFVILMATRRNQAIHDLITGSTVQIRDPAKASAGQYVTERTDLADPSMPPWWRRIVVIFGYLLLTFIAVGVVAVNSMSVGCIQDSSLCSAGERIFNVVVSVGFLFLTALIIGLGWTGRLYGARRARRAA